MAQAYPTEKIKENPDQIENNHGKMKEITCSSSGSNTSVPFKFNVQAPEFVPSSYNNTTTTQMPVSGYFYPCFHYIAGNDAGADWLYVGNEDSLQLVSSPSSVITTNSSKDVLTPELKQKIIKQVSCFSFSFLLIRMAIVIIGCSDKA